MSDNIKKIDLSTPGRILGAGDRDWETFISIIFF